MDREGSPLVQHASQNRQDINWWTVLLKPCLAEFVGTTLFVFAGVLSTFQKDEPGAIVNVALGHGLALFVMVSITAAISGGHLNPAVTLGVFLSGKLAPGVALGYVGAQLLGGISGSALARGLVSDNMTSGYALTEPQSYVGDAQGVFTETFLTAILVLTVLTMAIETRGQNNLAPFAIGMAVAAGIFAGGNVSGASMNPARSFGPAVVFGEWGRVWIYFVGCPIGALLASLVYRFILTKGKLPIPIVSSFQHRNDGL